MQSRESLVGALPTRRTAPQILGITPFYCSGGSSTDVYQWHTDCAYKRCVLCFFKTTLAMRREKDSNPRDQLRGKLCPWTCIQYLRPLGHLSSRSTEIFLIELSKKGDAHNPHNYELSPWSLHQLPILCSGIS